MKRLKISGLYETFICKNGFKSEKYVREKTHPDELKIDGG